VKKGFFSLDGSFLWVLIHSIHFTGALKLRASTLYWAYNA
jgi:hypothetical protein